MVWAADLIWATRLKMSPCLIPGCSHAQEQIPITFPASYSAYQGLQCMVMEDHPTTFNTPNQVAMQQVKMSGGTCTMQE